MPVGVETPASAADLPSPVDPYPVLPSTTVKGGGSGVIDGGKSWAQAWAETQRTAVKAGKPVSAPITQAEQIVRGAEGNVLVKGFTTGFMLGSGGLRIYSALKPDDWPDAIPESTCGDPVMSTVSMILYADLMPDCSIKVETPNVDVEGIGTWKSTWRGGTLNAWLEKSFYTPGFATVCWSFSPMPAAQVGAVRETGAGAAAGRTMPQWFRDPVSGNRVWPAWLQSSGQPAAVGLSGNSNYQGDPKVCGGELFYRFYSPPDPMADSLAAKGLVFAQTVGPDTNDLRSSGWKVSGATDPVSVEADPLRTAKCRVTMDDGTVLEGFVGQYRESEGFPMGAVSAACTDAAGNSVSQGLLPDTIELTSTDPNTGQEHAIATQDVPDFTETEKVGLTPGDNTGLRLLKVVSGVVQSCMTWEASCASWWPKTSSGTVPTTDEGTYRCEYGGREVPLSECGVYRETFDTKTEKPTVTDPVTGNKTDWSNTVDPANQFGTGAQSGQASDRCVTSFSFNPVDWVLRPIRCAFEPSKAKLDQVKARFQRAWSNSGVGGLSATLAGFVGSFNAAEGCGGLPLHIEGFGVTLVDTRLLAACDEPARGVAATVRAVLTVGILGAGLFASVRYLAALFGFTGYGRTNAGSDRGVRFE